MTREEFNKEVASKCCMTISDAKKATDAVLQTITEVMVKGDSISFLGFGSFSSKETQERKARNPQTGEEITIAASKKPVFKAGKGLKEAIKNAN